MPMYNSIATNIIKTIIVMILMTVCAGVLPIRFLIATGAPQWGHRSANSLTLLLHSGQLIRAI